MIKKLNQKAFTLTELLGVIAVLALIVIITVPIITGFLSDVKSDIFKDNARQLLNSAKLYYSDKIKEGLFEEKTFNFAGDVDLDFKGDKPKSGIITIDPNGNIKMSITDGKFCASKEYDTNEIVITKGECDKRDNDTTKPILILGNATSSTNSITIPFRAEDEESGIKSTKCEYGTSTDYGKIGTISGNTCTITKLKNNTTYYYKITSTNNAALNTIEKGNIKTGEFGTIDITATPTDWSKSKTIEITGEGSTLQYQIGSPDGTWITINSGDTFTINENTTIYARLWDGTNASETANLTITKIDRTGPTLTLGTASATTSSIIIPYTIEEIESGLETVTCKYSTTNGSYTSSGTATTSSCTMSGLTNNTTYYYQIIATDKVGNSKTITGSKKTNMMIFDSTNRNSEVNGGFILSGFTTKSSFSQEQVGRDTNIADSGSHLFFQASYAGTKMYVYYNHSIDMTDLKSIKYNMSLNRNCGEYQFSTNATYGVTSSLGAKDDVFALSDSLSLTKTETTTGTKTTQLDVSSLKGNQYLKFNILHGDEFDSCTSYLILNSVEGIY